MLTSQQVEEYQRDGFVVVRAAQIFERPEDLERVLGWCKEVCDWPEVPGKWMQYYERSLITGARILNRVEKFFDFHAQLRDLFCSSPQEAGAAASSSAERQDHPFEKIVAEAVGEPVVLFKEKINYKLAGGDAFKPHQDAQAGWDRYGHTIHFNVLFAIDTATLANGCLELVRGRHREGLLGPMWEELPEDVAGALPWEPVEMAPGDVILFNSYAPHRSAANMTQQQRRAMYVTYNLASEGDFRELYFADKRASFPPDIERKPDAVYQYKI
ncbi:MAG: phytanoyl-CoA dioxygenase family protein [archaeon]|nr:phytanoyl-CoA dioxygenase family protein [archaeon]